MDTKNNLRDLLETALISFGVCGIAMLCVCFVEYVWPLIAA